MSLSYELTTIIFVLFYLSFLYTFLKLGERQDKDYNIRQGDKIDLNSTSQLNHQTYVHEKLEYTFGTNLLNQTLVDELFQMIRENLDKNINSKFFNQPLSEKGMKENLDWDSERKKLFDEKMPSLSYENFIKIEEHVENHNSCPIYLNEITELKNPKKQLNNTKYLLPILKWGPNNQILGFYESAFMAKYLQAKLVVPPFFFSHTDEYHSRFNSKILEVPASLRVNLNEFDNLASLDHREER